MDKLRVIGQLGVDYFHVLRISIDEEITKVVEAASNVGAELPDGNTLAGANFAAHFIGDDKYRYINIISTLTYAISNFIDLTNLA